MKFIHTADWHIGQDFYHYDRGDEHRFFFRQLRAAIDRQDQRIDDRAIENSKPVQFIAT